MQPFPKYITYLLIAILVVGIACLYFAFVNKKDTNAQSDLLLQMAKKLGADSEVKSKKSEVRSEQPAQDEKTDDEIIRIADKICFAKTLDKEELKFYKKYKEEVDTEYEYSKTMRDNLIEKFVKGEKEFTEDEKTFYESYQGEIDIYVQVRLNPESAAEPSKPSQPSEPSKLGKANPPMAPAERLKLILSFFADGIPKTISELAPMYAAATGTKGSAGSLYNLFGRLEDGTLQTIKMIVNDHARVYYGLPEWFDGKKLKIKYAHAEWFDKNGKIEKEFKKYIS